MFGLGLQRNLNYRVSCVVHRIRCSYNQLFNFQSLVNDRQGLHLGCGEQRIPNLINLDYRATKATDLIKNCSNLRGFPNNTFLCVFSNAFFEHVYLNQRLKLLKETRRVLKDNGYTLFIGIPDFEAVADFYLKKVPGFYNPTFNAFEAYRFTHGEPEQVDGWTEGQLHKSLIDKDTLNNLLGQARFEDWYLFNYCFKNEYLPINLGFIAYKKSQNFKGDKKSQILKTIKMWNDTVNEKSIVIYGKDIN